MEKALSVSTTRSQSPAPQPLPPQTMPHSNLGRHIPLKLQHTYPLFPAILHDVHTDGTNSDNSYSVVDSKDISCIKQPCPKTPFATSIEYKNSGAVIRTRGGAAEWSWTEFSLNTSSTHQP